MSALEWVRDESGIDWPRALLAALAVTVFVALVVAGATSTAAFGPYNPSWDGTSELRQDVASEPGVESELLRETSSYEEGDPNETVAFVVAPEEEYTGEDAARLRTFVEDGGTLVVLENFGASGNELLTSVGADARAEGTLLRDEQEHHRGPTMPIATGVADHPRTGGVDQLTLNHASAVEPNGATVLVETSGFAYRDAERDGELGDEELGAVPVATVENVSSGQVVAVGDPSIAVNAMIDEPDNAAFLRAQYADADRVLIDLSHTDEVPPLAGAALTLRETLPLQLLAGALGIGAVALLSRRRESSIGGRLRAVLPARLDGGATAGGTEPTLERDDERLAALLRRRHPEWDEERVQRVIAALNRRDSERQDE